MRGALSAGAAELRVQPARASRRPVDRYEAGPAPPYKVQRLVQQQSIAKAAAEGGSVPLQRLLWPPGRQSFLEAQAPIKTRSGTKGTANDDVGVDSSSDARSKANRMARTQNLLQAAEAVLEAAAAEIIKSAVYLYMILLSTKHTVRLRALGPARVPEYSCKEYRKS